jgi:hypothetical protein
MAQYKKSKLFIYLLIVFLFLFGIYFMMNNPKEPFVTGQCPTTMIKDGSKILLYNPEYAHVPGVNPLEMKDLEDYKEYIEWQRSNKLNCPVLHLEKVFDAQGAPMYEIRPSFDTELNVGGMNHSLPVVKNKANIKQTMDAALDSSPFNCNQYASYDKDNQNIGVVGV